MEFQVITLADFIQDVMPSSGHNRTEILTMAVGQENTERRKEPGEEGPVKMGADLLYHHVDEHYRITIDSIRAYFVENPRPKKALSAEEENKALKAKVAELEEKVGKEKAVKPGPTVAKDEIPPKDEGIPAKKLSQTDFAAELRKDLKGAKSPGVKAIASATKKDIPKGK